MNVLSKTKIYQRNVYLIALVVASQVGQDPSGAGDDVDVSGRQHLHQGGQEPFQALNLQ